MEKTSLHCILHFGAGNEVGDIKSFKDNDLVWQSTKLVSERRKASQKKSKYVLIDSLPDSPTELSGYHSSCLKNFTAFPITDTVISPSNPVISPVTRSKTPLPLSSPTGVLPPTCVFCNQVRKKVKGSITYPQRNKSWETENAIREAAYKINDSDLIVKLGEYLNNEGPDFVALEVQYHKKCKQDYIKKARSTIPSKNYLTKEKSYVKPVDYVRSSIIEQDRPEMASSLLSKYIEIYIDNGGEMKDVERYTVQSLCKRLQKTLAESLKITAGVGKGTVLHKDSNMTLEGVLAKAKELEGKDKNIVLTCASILRKSILSAEKILKGEVNCPNILKEFYINLYTGQSSQDGISPKKARFVDSSCADSMFMWSGSKSLPGKHLGLA